LERLAGARRGGVAQLYSDECDRSATLESSPPRSRGSSGLSRVVAEQHARWQHAPSRIDCAARLRVFVK